MSASDDIAQVRAALDPFVQSGQPPASWGRGMETNRATAYYNTFWRALADGA